MKPSLDHRVPRWAALACICILLTGIVLCATRLRLDSDILSSLPKGHQEANGFKDLITHFDFFNTAFVLVEGDDPTLVDKTVSALADQLQNQSENFSSVQMGGGTLEELQAFQTWMRENLSLLLPESEQIALSKDLTLQSMQEHLAVFKQGLREPSGLLLKNQFLKDPLGLMTHLNPILESMKSRAPPMDERGRFSRMDGRERLLILKSKWPAMDSRSAEKVNGALLLAMDRAKTPGIKINWGGAYRIVAENAEAVQSSLQRTLWLGGLGLMLLFFVVLRSPRYVIVILIPSLLACSSAAGWSMLLWPDLHVLALAFSGVLIGVSTDYSLHACMLIQSKNQDRRAWTPIWAGGLSTALAFGVLWFSDFKCLQQAGLVGGFGMALSLMATRVFVPQFLVWMTLPPLRCPIMPGVHKVFNLLSSPFGRLGILAVLFFLGCGIFRLNFDGRPERMDAKSSISVDLEERLARDWNMNLKPILILTEAPNRETLLQWQESILNTLHQNHAKFLSFNPWLPSMALQSSRRAWWTQTVTKPHAQHWDNFCQVSQTIGLKPEFCRSAFDSYVKVPTTLPATSSLALLGRMEKSFMADTQERSLGLILVNESWESLQNLRATLPPHSLLLSRSHLAEEMARGIKDEFLELSFLAALTILVCCAWAFKDFKKTLRAIFPVFAGLLGLLGGMGWLGFSADLMTVMMMVMILGAGVDYGIVLIHEASEKNGPQTAGMVVAICTSTTVLSLLSMSTSGHPVFLSIGWTGGLGILGVSLLSFIFCHRFKSSV